MDKELLRIAIIATGLIIMVAMIVSAYLKSRQENDDEYEEYEDEFDEDEYEEDFDDEPVKKPSLAQSLKNAYNQKVQQVQQQRQKLVPVVEDDDDDESDFEVEPAPKSHKKEATSPSEAPHQSASPSILQFSVITKGQDDFNVADVFHVLEQLGMEYGSMKVFERVDENRFVHFGVASMVEPGTFPDTDLENHYCPGVVFFMQFDDLANPREVFDDYVATAMLFAQEMDGVVLDHRRQPLTDAMVNAIRAAM